MGDFAPIVGESSEELNRETSKRITSLLKPHKRIRRSSMQLASQLTAPSSQFTARRSQHPIHKSQLALHSSHFQLRLTSHNSLFTNRKAQHTTHSSFGCFDFTFRISQFSPHSPQLTFHSSFFTKTHLGDFATISRGSYLHQEPNRKISFPLLEILARLENPPGGFCLNRLEVLPTPKPRLGDFAAIF